MKTKPTHYLIFPRKVVDEITWPENWRNQCEANLPEMLREKLKVKTGIGSEIKLIWNYWHRRQIIDEHKVTNSDLDDYVRANCTMLSFRNEKLKDKTVKTLIEMGAISPLICTTEYREVILKQAEYIRTGRFSNNA